MLLLLVVLLLLLLVVVILVADVPCLGLLNDVLFRTGTILGRPRVVAVYFARRDHGRVVG